MPVQRLPHHRYFASLVGRALAGATLLLGMGGAPAAASSPVAMITDLQGQVGKAGDGQACALFATLETGDRLTLAAGAQVTVVYLQGGAQYHARGSNEMIVGAQGAQLRDGRLAPSRRSALSSNAAALDVRDGRLRQAGMAMRGGSAATPQGKILASHPVLRWPALAPGATASLRIEEAEGADERVLLEQPVAGTSLLLPRAIRLVPGRAYVWRLTVSEAAFSYVAHTAVFSVASASERARYARLTPAATASVSDRLIYAKLLEQEGYAADAEEQWRQIVQQRPDLQSAAPRLIP